MPKSRIILCLGFFIALLPVLGFPNSWDHFFDTALGLLIVLLSVLISVDRRLTMKAKAEKRAHRKRAVSTPPAEAPMPEPEPVSAQAFSMPEPAREVQVEAAPEPFFETSSTFDASHSAPAFEAHPRRRRRVKVVDADATPPEISPAPETPIITEETFGTDTTEF